MIDLLLHRYHDLNYAFSLPFRSGVDLYRKAQEMERDERFFAQWVAQLPYMDKDHFVSFDNYRAHLTGADIDMRPAEEILAELDALESGENNGT